MKSESPPRLSQGEPALVTGGTDGIGKEVARGLAKAGCAVILVGRDPEKGLKAQAELREHTRNRDVSFVQADLSLVRGVNLLADQVFRRWSGLRYLVHSAGIVRGRYELTEDGIESNFAVNYLGRFALTERLLPLLLARGSCDAAARILIIGGAARDGAIHFEDPNLARGFSTLRAVSQFCAANDVFTIELARRLALTNPEPQVTIANLKVGVVKTNIRKEFPGWMKWLVPLVMDPLLGQTPAEVAGPALALLLGVDTKPSTGALFLKIRKFKQIAPGPRVADAEVGRRLWDLSAALVAAANG